MLPHATRKDPRLQHSNEQLGHAIAIMPARIEKNKNFMNVTNRVLQCCAVVKNYGRKNAKLAWTTPFVPDTFLCFLFVFAGQDFRAKLEPVGEHPLYGITLSINQPDICRGFQQAATSFPAETNYNV